MENLEECFEGGSAIALVHQGTPLAPEQRAEDGPASTNRIFKSLLHRNQGNLTCDARNRLTVVVASGHPRGPDARSVGSEFVGKREGAGEWKTVNPSSGKK